MSVLISDLNTVPGIIGGLGLGIAQAQKELNADYVASLKAIVLLLKEAGIPAAAEGDPKAQFFANLLMQLSPPRYQYTTVTLDVRMDLSQSTDRAISLGGGFAMGAIAVSGSFAQSSTQQYRAAAEVRTVIDAMLPTGDNKAIFEALLTAAKKSDPDAKPALPAQAVHDQKLLELTKELTTALAPKK